MSQRGGSVTSHVRWGPVVYSPLIPTGGADILVGFEQVETVRYAHFLRPGGRVLVNQQAITPITVSAGSSTYPTTESLREHLARVADHVFWIPAIDIARTMGNDKVTNVVMLGALSALLDVPERIWLKVIESRVPGRYLQLNHQAFQRGREALLVVESIATAQATGAIPDVSPSTRRSP